MSELHVLGAWSACLVTCRELQEFPSVVDSDNLHSFPFFDGRGRLIITVMIIFLATVSHVVIQALVCVAHMISCGIFAIHHG